MKRIARTLDRFATALEVTIALLFVTLFLVTMLNILLRNVGGVAWLWIPGFTRLVFIWMVFLGIAAVYRRRDHLVVDFFLTRLAKKRQLAVTFVIHLALIPFFWVLFDFGREVARVRMRIPFDTWDLPTGWAYMAVPVAAVLLLTFAIERLVKTWLELRTP